MKKTNTNKKNIYKKNISDSKDKNLTTIKINNKGTFILSAENKQNYPDREIQVITQNMQYNQKYPATKSKRTIT